MAALSGALAIGTDAQAQIVATDVSGDGSTGFINRIAKPAVTYVFGPNNSLHLKLGYLAGGSTFDGYLREQGTAVAFSVASSSAVVKEQKGTLVGKNLPAGSYAWADTRLLLGTGSSSKSTGYFIFRFSVGSGYDYGWAEYSYQAVSESSANLKLTEIAYAENGASIPVGDTSIPEPTSASLLAMGAMAMGARGVRRMRRARAAAKKAA